MSANDRSVVSEEAQSTSEAEAEMMNLIYQLQISGGDEQSKSKSKRPMDAPAPLWKTPFEIDAPRHLACAGRRSAGMKSTRIPATSHSAHAQTATRQQIYNKHDDIDASSSTSSESQTRGLSSLTPEQNAWMGIDDLLDQQSLDGSLAISTAEILPDAIVRAMKRTLSKSSLSTSDESIISAIDHDHDHDSGDDHDENNDESSQSRALYRTLSQVMRKQPQHIQEPNSMPSLIDASAEADLRKRDSVRAHRNRSHPDPQRSEKDAKGTASNLFDVFIWSAKDNVDKEKTRKRKMNQALRFNSKANVVIEDDHEQSIPSLSTFQDRDLGLRFNPSDVVGNGRSVDSRSETSPASETNPDERSFPIAPSVVEPTSEMDRQEILRGDVELQHCADFDGSEDIDTAEDSEHSISQDDDDDGGSDYSSRSSQIDDDDDNEANHNLGQIWQMGSDFEASFQNHPIKVPPHFTADGGSYREEKIAETKNIRTLPPPSVCSSGASEEQSTDNENKEIMGKMMLSQNAPQSFVEETPLVFERPKVELGGGSASASSATRSKTGKSPESQGSIWSEELPEFPPLPPPNLPEAAPTSDKPPSKRRVPRTTAKKKRSQQKKRSKKKGKKGSRKPEKKEAKMSLSEHLRMSLKNMRKRGKSTKKETKPAALEGRSEARFFPRLLGHSVQKEDPNRCLLNVEQDGVNWD